MSRHDQPAPLTRRGILAGAAALAASIEPSRAQPAMLRPGATDALIVVDMQYDFLPGGALAVKGGDEIAPAINALGAKFEKVILTQDWHTKGHVSFASSHAGKKPFETVRLAYGEQVLWPDHCVQGTRGAAITDAVSIPHAQLVIRKGFHADLDSYSAFLEADGRTPTGLAGYLRERGVTRVLCVGLATDFCVAWTALDARKLGFEAVVIEDATRAIDANGSLAAAWRDMTAAGVQRAKAAEVG